MFIFKWLRKNIDKMAHYGLANIIAKLFQIIGITIGSILNIQIGFFVIASFIFVLAGSIYWEKYHQKHDGYFNIYDILFGLLGWISGTIGVIK